jgi:hypothetical protein
MQPIKTNNLNIDFNYTNILNDFSIFKCTTADKFIEYGSLILDETITGLKAQSVVFERGRSFYSLFKGSDINTNFISSSLKNVNEGDKLSVEKINSIEGLKTIPKYLLAQLLINSLSSPQNEFLAFNNLTGSLLCFNPLHFYRRQEKILKIPAIKFRIDKWLCLQLEVKTFSNLLLLNELNLRTTLKDYPKYTISHSRQKLRRVLPNEKLNTEDVFIEKQEPNKKSTIPFLSIKDSDSFLASKMGFLYSIFNDVNKKLSDYITINFENVVPTESLRYDQKIKHLKDLRVNEILDNFNIHIVDLVNDEISKEFISDTKNSILKFSPERNISIGKRIKKDAFNFIIIHNAEYYSRYNMEDPYNSKNKKSLLYQHITIEDYKHSSKSVFNNVIKELCIKSDIQDKFLKIIDWKSFGYQNNWKFGIKKDNLFYFVEISPEGYMEFYEFENNLFNQSEYTNYCDAYEDAESDPQASTVEGIVVSDKGEINTIQKTSMYTIPDFINIGSTFEEVNTPFKIKKENFLAIFNDFCKLSNHGSLEDIKSNLNNYNSDILDRETILKLINHRTIKKGFTEYFYKRTGYLLHYYFKDALKRYELLDSNLDIKYYSLNNLAYYFVGTKGIGIQSNFPHASVIRKVVPYNSNDILFDKLLPTMNVDFVKHEDITVLPFPFKYLKEYVNLIKINQKN